jgi:hypothetical protein
LQFFGHIIGFIVIVYPFFLGSKVFYKQFRFFWMVPKFRR